MCLFRKCVTSHIIVKEKGKIVGLYFVKLKIINGLSKDTKLLCDEIDFKLISVRLMMLSIKNLLWIYNGDDACYI